MATQRNVVVAVFEDRQKAQRAIDELRLAGFREEQIGVAGRHPEFPSDAYQGETYAEEGAAAGVLSGAAVGGLWGIGIAAGLLPAIGPVIAGGTLAAIFASAATGAAVAGVAGALIGMGIPEEEARYYEGEFKAGRTVVTVQADGRSEEAVNVLRRHGSYDIESRRAGQSAGASAPASRERTGV
jgi:hypothetical protein